jgi:hypothetical protein
MIISIASPDKLSISMFGSFIRPNIGNSHKVGEVHSLMDFDSVNAYVDSFLKINNNCAIFTYYAKKKINIDPLIVVPKKLLEVSDAVIWFNLYETSYKLIKDKINFDNLFLESWNNNLKKLDMGRR